jgi:hypothetical protein
MCSNRDTKITRDFNLFNVEILEIISGNPKSWVRFGQIAGKTGFDCLLVHFLVPFANTPLLPKTDLLATNASRFSF